MDEATVLHRLSDYQRLGWISQIDAAQYRSVMNQRRNDAVTLRQISTRLDEIALKGTGVTSISAVSGGSNLTVKHAKNDKAAAVASPTYTASSSTTASSLLSGMTSSASLASTTDPNLMSEYGDDDDEEDEVAAVAPAKTLPAKSKAGNGGKKAEPQISSSSPYLRSLQCISNITDVNPKSEGKSSHAAKGQTNRPNNHHVRWKDDDDIKVVAKDEDDDVAAAPLVLGSSIVEPSQLWRASSDSLNPALLQELFVEMCFYARLGFVQPPCCLKCTYRHAHTNGNSNAKGEKSDDGNADRSSRGTSCQQFVVWRKNASTVLHPGTLGTNIVLVPCMDAQKLLDGQVVSGYYWDAAKKRLQLTEPSAKAAPSARA